MRGGFIEPHCEFADGNVEKVEYSGKNCRWSNKQARGPTTDHNVYGAHVERVTMMFSVGRDGFPLSRIAFRIFKTSITPQVERIRHGMVLRTRLEVLLIKQYVVFTVVVT